MGLFFIYAHMYSIYALNELKFSFPSALFSIDHKLSPLFYRGFNSLPQSSDRVFFKSSANEKR